MFLTNDLDTIFFGVVNLRYSGSAGDVAGKTCGGLPGGAWPSNLLSSMFPVSNKIDIGLVNCGIVASRIAYPWPSMPWGGSCW